MNFIFNEAKKKVEDNVGPCIVADLYNDLGATFNSEKNFQIAKMCFILSINLNKKITRDKSMDVKLDFLDEAFANFEEACQLHKKQFGENSIHVAMYFNNRAIAYKTQKDYEKARGEIEKQ